jgi:hypothetical protein
MAGLDPTPPPPTPSPSGSTPLDLLDGNRDMAIPFDLGKDDLPGIGIDLTFNEFSRYISRSIL